MCSKKGFIIKSLFIFSIFFIILSGADFLTTSYALDNQLGYEANGVMSGIVNNTIAFLSVKALFVTVIIMLMSKCLKQSKKISHIGMRVIIFMMLFVVANNILVINASAADNPFYSPTCINPSYDSGYNQMWTSNNASSGSVAGVELSSAGTIISGNFRIINGSNILCTISSRTTETSGITRMFGTSEDGSVFYFDNNLVDYSLGFYTVSPVTFSCSGSGGNCNPIYKIGTLSATTLNRKLAEDSYGNIYTSDAGVIYVYNKASGYAQSVFYTLVSGTDYTAGTGGTASVDIIDINIDSSNTLHVLVGTRVTCGGTCISHVYLSKTTISSVGVRTYSDLSIVDHLNNYGGGTPNAHEILMGGMVIDSTNSTYNYSIIYLMDTVNGGTTLDHINTPVLIHRTGTTSTVISSITLTSVSDLDYYNNMLFVSSWNDNIIRTYGTIYIGLIPSSAFLGTTEITYDTKTVSSIYSTYYNTSNIMVNYNIVFDRFSIENLLLDSSNYRWMIAMVDPNNIEKDVYQTAICTHTLLGSTCSVSETLEYAYPSNGWLAGSWSLKLYEINTVVPNRALIATSAPFTVLNTSLENQSQITDPTIPINSGSGATALTTVDNWTAMFGLGVNPISKFMFAMMWIVFFSFTGFIATKFNLNGGIMMALFPFTFFIYIEYLPLWTVVIITMMVGIKLFR